MNREYITTAQLSERIHYDERTIRNRLNDSVLHEGIHYFRPFGGRKILYYWDAIERDMVKYSLEHAPLTEASVEHPDHDGLPANAEDDRKGVRRRPGSGRSMPKVKSPVDLSANR